MKTRLLTVSLALAFAVPVLAGAVDIIPKPVDKQVSLAVKVYSLKGSDVTTSSHVETVKPMPTSGGYAIVVSKGTYGDPNWKKLVRALAVKHNAETLVFSDKVDSVREELAKRMPRCVCFVSMSSEAQRLFVINVSRMMRKLDDDPYTDAIWGIVTGYDAGDAARIVAQSKPLIIRKGAAGTPLNLDSFDEGVWYDEGKKNHMVEKKPGGKPTDKTCPDDTAGAIANVLNSYKPDYFQTSGHASERDWAIGYSYPNGRFVCKDGVLMGLDMKGNKYPIVSPNPKVYAPIGNCLMGHVADRQSMAIAFMGSAGVAQMAGYTVETWYGYGGWGILDYFHGQPGRFTFAESFFLNNQALVRRIQKQYPDNASFEYANWKEDRIDIGGFAAAVNGKDNDEVGLHWDRDVVAFYGDPAWEARMTPRNPAWTQTIKSKSNVLTFEITALQNAAPGRPFAAMLPERVKLVKVLEGSDYEPVITDNFIMLPELTKIEKGKTYRVVFSVERMVPTPATPVAEEKQPDVAKALTAAGDNKIELIAALRLAPAEQKKAVAFLIANMPESDLKSLDRYFLLENTALAYQARSETPWGNQITGDLFLNNVLPYASMNERRDSFRKDLHDRFIGAASACKTPGEAAVKLNKLVFDSCNVRYHATKRPKPDQSPYESAEASYASCSGLSILLADALRSVGIPARVAGTPLWMDKSGNHTWVEVWDGKWHFIESAGGDPLDKSWFAAKAAQADPRSPANWIYAASFKKTGLSFPLVWDPSIKWVNAVDVTKSYKGSTK